MIKMLTALAAAAVVLPSAASAQVVGAAEDRLEVLGTAFQACVILTPSASSGNNATFEPASGNSGEIRITDFVNPSTATARAASISLALPVICNSPHRLVLRSSNGGLRRDGAGAGSQGPFAEFKAYQMAASWGPVALNAMSDADGQLVINSATARAGDVSITIDVGEGGQPLVAGTYSDEIVVEFRAAN